MEQNEQLFTFPVETPAQRSLVGAGTWAKFLAILGFVFIALMLIVLAIAGSNVMAAFDTVLPIDATPSAGFFTVFVVVICAIFGVLCYLLIRGATLVRRGIYTNDQLIFNAGLASYRTFFILYGIVSIFSLLYDVYQLFK